MRAAASWGIKRDAVIEMDSVKLVVRRQEDGRQRMKYGLRLK
jgi:hypothetical protein